MIFSEPEGLRDLHCIDHLTCVYQPFVLCGSTPLRLDSSYEKLRQSSFLGSVDSKKSLAMGPHFSSGRGGDPAPS